MQLSEAQRLALKAFIQNDATLGPKAAAKDYDGVANGLNAQAAGPFYGIRTDAPIAAILDKILFAKYTPNTAITSGNAAQHAAVTNLAMAKQNNLILLGITRQAGDGTFDASRPTQVATLKDAATALPTQGASFTNQDVGWDSGTTGATDFVSNQLVRPVTVAEKVFAAAGAVPTLNDGVTPLGGWNTGTGKGNPALLGPQGPVDVLQIGDVLA